jgi:hypothetical protein
MIRSWYCETANNAQLPAEGLEIKGKSYERLPGGS